MKTLKFSFFTLLLFLFSSCGSIQSTLKNIDNNAIKPTVIENHFVITEYSSDKKYGYDKDYPINLGFENEKKSESKSNAKKKKTLRKRKRIGSRRAKIDEH